MKLLKERIDGHLPISKSPVLSQMKGILASSSKLPCQVLEQSGSSEGLKKTSSQELSNSESSTSSSAYAVKGNSIGNYRMVVSSDDEREIFGP